MKESYRLKSTNDAELNGIEVLLWATWTIVCYRHDIVPSGRVEAGFSTRKLRLCNGPGKLHQTVFWECIDGEVMSLSDVPGTFTSLHLTRTMRDFVILANIELLSIKLSWYNLTMGDWGQVLGFYFCLANSPNKNCDPNV